MKSVIKLLICIITIALVGIGTMGLFSLGFNCVANVLHIVVNPIITMVLSGITLLLSLVVTGWAK